MHQGLLYEKTSKAVAYEDDGALHSIVMPAVRRELRYQAGGIW